MFVCQLFMSQELRLHELAAASGLAPIICKVAALPHLVADSRNVHVQANLGAVMGQISGQICREHFQLEHYLAASPVSIPLDARLFQACK